MKLIFLVALCAWALISAGCEAVSDAGDRVRDRLGKREEARTRIYEATPRATYDAARKAAEQMGYRFVRGGAAQGELEAVSGIGSNDRLSSSRQISMFARFNSTLEGGTEVSLTLKEIIESDSVQRAGQATATTLRDTPQYEVFFRYVQQGLDAGKNPEKP
jgi:hypothetical protein